MQPVSPGELSIFDISILFGFSHVTSTNTHTHTHFLFDHNELQTTVNVDRRASGLQNCFHANSVMLGFCAKVSLLEMRVLEAFLMCAHDAHIFLSPTNERLAVFFKRIKFG